MNATERRTVEVSIFVISFNEKLLCSLANQLRSTQLLLLLVKEQKQGIHKQPVITGEGPTKEANNCTASVQYNK